MKYRRLVRFVFSFVLVAWHLSAQGTTTEELEDYVNKADDEVVLECIYNVDFYIKIIKQLKASAINPEDFIKEAEITAKEDGFDYTTIRDFVMGFYYHETTPDDVKYKLILIELKDCIQHELYKPLQM